MRPFFLAKSTSLRAPNRSQRNDNDFFEYESRPSETARDKGFYMFHDGLRGFQSAHNIGVKRRRVCPSDLVDALGDWEPLPGEAEEELPDEERIDNVEAGEKRKRYLSSDDPMSLWRNLKQFFLDETIRADGLGDALDEKACSCCKNAYTRHSRRFRCTDCGVFVQCLDCVRSRHSLGPSHRIKEWKGAFWARTTLKDLGVVYQLGHGGHACPRPAPVTHEMVVMDTEAIHTVTYQYCGGTPATTVDSATCATFQALETFRVLNVIGNINVHDFVGAMESQTDAACDVEKVPDRYKAFGHMSRQFSFLKRIKRAGLGHQPTPLRCTRKGACGVECWTCPHDGKNLPEGWRDVAPEYQFLYMLLLAMDTNFRLKNRLRANEREDPPLGDGWGYIVEDAPYKSHLRNYVAEKDVSTCIAFAALLQKDTRMTTGLRCSGVGGVVCARHELVRPQGIGDLQKGERYSNMDYILLSAILGVTAMYLAISYDIACQWKINLQSRMAAMPEQLRLDLASIVLLFALPVWHAAAHEVSCQNENSLTYLDGVGRTDGEGIERTWSVLNPISCATKEMGAGARADAIEDKIDHHNFAKNIGQGTTLPCKLIIATDERDRQVAAFKEVDQTLRSSVKRDWQAKIDAWKADHTQPNPYLLSGGRKRGATEAVIRLALTKDEADEAATGGGKLHGSSLTSFLVGGLQLEEAQQRIKREARGRTLLVADQQERVQEMRVAFFSKLRRWRKLQAVYMAAAVRELEAEEDARDPELPPPKAEDIKLYLPSGLLRADRVDGCRKGLPAMEAKLREGQCEDSITLLRSRLHAKRHLLNYRDESVVGQRAATRAYTLIGQLGERVDAVSAKYRRARSALIALIALRGRAECEKWKELKAADVQLDEEREIDAAAHKRLGNISSRARRQGPALSSKKKTFSWIWTGGGGGPGEDEAELHDSVRVEWSKAKARKEHWEEEVELLREEMKRESMAASRGEVSREVASGLAAYAARQAALHRDLARKFQTAWETSATTAVRTAVREDGLLVEAMSAFARIAGDVVNLPAYMEASKAGKTRAWWPGLFSEYWRLFHWRLPLDEELGDDAMVVVNEVEELTAEEEKSKTAVQTRIKSKIKTWYNHHRNAMGMTSNLYTPWLARLRCPDGASPKRVTDYQFYMQHEEFKAAVEEEFQLRHAHEPRRQHLSLRCQVAREFFERESEEVKKRIRLEAQLEHEDQLEQWKDAEEGLPSANEEEQVEARLRFSAVVTPLLNALRAYTSYHITLIAGRLVDDSKVALVSVHSGKTKAKSVDLEKDFTEWDEGGYKVVLDQFVRFLVDANVEPREETEMTEPAPTTAPLPTASTSPTPIVTTRVHGRIDLGRQTTPPPPGSLEARMIELGVRTALRRELESMDEEARESRVTELMGLSAMALQRRNRSDEGQGKRKPTRKTAPKKKRPRLEESDEEESAESSGSDVSEGEGLVEPPQTRARRRGASGGEGANGEDGDTANDHNNDSAARETASHGGGTAKNNDTDARGTASQDADADTDAANDHNNNTAARETANHGETDTTDKDVPGDWASDAREVMEKEWKGWGELVSLWWKLEEGSGFTSKGGALTTKGRPTEVGWWIQRARKGTPPIKDMGAFAQAWKGWWGAVNPAWQRVKTGGMAQEGDGGWEELGARGANGLLSVVMCLKWWKEELGNADDEEWVESVLDVTWMLRRLIASNAGVEGDVDVDMGANDAQVIFKVRQPKKSLLPRP
ncbi:hypothetical protein C8R46DRAFT_1214526 [Mycena filopes]|nr:hypothetical protein C8R46DRAFT_1214526 [Mycena filopes]